MVSIDAQNGTNPLFQNNGVNNLAIATVESGNHFFNSTFNSNNSTTGSTFAAYLEIETESPLNIEEWMLDDSNFSSATLIESEIEVPLELELWMVNEKTFNANSVAIKTATDEQMDLE